MASVAVGAQADIVDIDIESLLCPRRDGRPRYQGEGGHGAFPATRDLKGPTGPVYVEEASVVEDIDVTGYGGSTADPCFDVE